MSTFAAPRPAWVKPTLLAAPLEAYVSEGPVERHPVPGLLSVLTGAGETTLSTQVRNASALVWRL